jgi:hypothetical protein
VSEYLRLGSPDQPKTFCPGCSKNVLARFAIRGHCRECAGRLGVQNDERPEGDVQLTLGPL